MGGRRVNKNIPLKILKYIGLVPIILLFIACLTILPLLYSIDNTMSQNLSPDVIVVILEEGSRSQPNIFNLIKTYCQNEDELDFDEYVVPCSVVGDKDWNSTAEYIAQNYPQTYYELVPEDEIDVSRAINCFAIPALYVLIVVAIVLMILFAKGRIFSMLDYFSLSLLLAGVAYITLNLSLIQILSASGLPDFVSSLIPDFLPPLFIGYIYIGFAVIAKFVEVFLDGMKK